MKGNRIHILGASAAGTTTLGNQLARELGCPHFDADNFYWEPTDPPFTTKRSVEERRFLLEKELQGRASWVLSGSMVGWGNFLKPALTQVVFLSLSQSIRMERLIHRERERFGQRILPGGDMKKQHHEFVEWAMRYDTGGLDVRSRALHEQWMRSLPCPIVRVDGILPTPVQCELVRNELSHRLENISVATMKGSDAAPLVDPFFQWQGRTTLAKPSDIFFVARAGKEVVGVVRYCVEENTHMLRGMLVAERARKQGVGQKLLLAFDAHLKKHKIGPVFCLPHQHLTTFYALAGFRRIKDSDAPPFLQERLRLYRENEMPDVIPLKRT